MATMTAVKPIGSSSRSGHLSLAALPATASPNPVWRCSCSPSGAHHWLIGPDIGITSKGVCQHCGEYRMFYNDLIDLVEQRWDRRVKAASPVIHDCLLDDF